MSIRRILFVFLSVMLPLVLTGCYERDTQGAQNIYHFSAWVGPVLIVIGLAMLALGAVLVKRKKYWGMFFLFVAAMILALVAPGSFTDRVIVDDEHFEAGYGFVFSPIQHKIRFNELSEIRYLLVDYGDGRKFYELQCVHTSGKTVVVNAGDLVSKSVPDILERAKRKGVLITR